MSVLLVVLIILACIVLGFFILIQKPKGGGLSGAFGSIGSQVMGVKQSGDVMERGTWYTMILIVILCVLSVFTLNIPKAPKQEKQPIQQTSNQQQQTPAK